jgi:SAM-dependent methyltransferase
MRVDAEMLRRQLDAYRSEWEEPGVRGPLVEGALPRIAATLRLLPDAGAEARLLELGSPPFFTSLCLERVWPGRITHTSYAHDAARRRTERVIPVAGGPDRVFELDCFNVETDEFPYPDETFDVVVFSELIEHLAVNPVWTLAEIHRVLRPGGHVIVTTPNAISLERLWTFLHGGSQTVDRYVPLLGYGARHNREWHPAELREVLESTGFDVEEMVVCDLRPRPPWSRLARAGLRLFLRPFSRQSRRSHIFLRARRRDVFRWRFPVRLFEHMALYRVVRHPWVEMGVNDTIQCGEGWVPRDDEDTPPAARTDETIRRVQMPAGEDGAAVVWLRARAGARALALRLRAEDGPARLGLGLRDAGATLLDTTVTVPAGDWTEVRVPLARPPAEGAELELRLTAAAASRLAFRRIWLEGG